MTRRSAIVIDASVACKWFVEETGTASAREVLAQALLADPGTWIGPELFHCEVLNAVRKARPRTARLEEVARFLASLPMRSVGFDAEIGSRIAAHAGKGVGVYDAFYAAVCDRHSAMLFTADVRLCRALGAPSWVRLVA